MIKKEAQNGAVFSEKTKLLRGVFRTESVLLWMARDLSCFPRLGENVLKAEKAARMMTNEKIERKVRRRSGRDDVSKL